jgi:pimeloyl-ACP methyl ester carboxylesterase
MPITLQEANRRLERALRWIKHVLLAVSFVAAASPCAFAARSELVQLRPRGEAVQAYLLIREDAPVKTVVILVSGGFGLLKFQTTDAGVQWDQSVADFLVRNKDRFLDQDTAVAVIDAPSDQWSFGYTPKLRKSATHMEDLRAVVNDIKSRLPGSKVFLIGNSQGSTSAAYAGKAFGKDIDGVVLSASVFDWAPATWRLLHDANLSDFDFSRISSPLLFVHHADDRCVATPFSSAIKYQGKYPLLVVQGGDPVRDNGCGPLGPHGFLGREDAVVTEIKNWIYGRPFKADLK